MLFPKTPVDKAEYFTSCCRKVLNEISTLLLAFFYEALKENKLTIICFYMGFLENRMFDFSIAFFSLCILNLKYKTTI